MTNSNKIEVNYKKALLLYKNNNALAAEKLLLENIEMSTDDCKTYDLLIKIYDILNNYNKLIKILNRAIKFCKDNRADYRELKKVVILNELLKDLNHNK